MNYISDIKYALRVWAKSWDHSLLSVVVVALSLGLAVWTYALVYSQALKPLGFQDSDRWYSIQIARTDATSPRPAVDAFTYQKIVDLSPHITHLGAFSSYGALLDEGEASVLLRVADISPRLLAATNAIPLLGRLFEKVNSEIDAAPVTILSYDSWKNYFGGDQNIIGRQVSIDSRSVRVIGVMPKDFFLFHDFELWMPLQLGRLVRADVSGKSLSPFVILNSGQSASELVSTMQVTVNEINQDYPAIFEQGRYIELIPARLALTHQILHVVKIIALLSIAILLLACVNISLIFLSRLLERSRELALRSAIGASRGRLMGQCLTETGLVISIGLVIGLGVAWLGVQWGKDLTAFTAQILARGRAGNDIDLHAADVIIAVLIAIVIWLLSTIVPAWRIARQDAATVLAGTGKGSAAKGNSKSTNLLVGLQVLVSSAVLVVCGNLALAISQETNEPLGIDFDQVMVTTKPTSFDQDYIDASQKLGYWDDLERSIISRNPDATVAYSTAIPIQPQYVAVGPETDESSGRARIRLPVKAVSENYFDLLDIRLRLGRMFDSTDIDASINVAVIDEITAERFWPDESAIGKRIQIRPSEEGPWLTVVGVVSAVSGAPYSPKLGIIYRPLRQEMPQSFYTMVKLPSDSTGSVATLRAAAFQVDRDMPMSNLQTLEDYLTVVYLNTGSIVPVLSAITIITVILAATGLFGLISRSVAQRTQEVGIRRALGATKLQSISMFLRQGGMYMIVAMFGMIIGVIFTNLGATFFVNALDNIVPVTISIFLLLLLVIFSSSYFPAKRALDLDPGDALRYE